jgi:hypothetical protein
MYGLVNHAFDHDIFRIDILGAAPRRQCPASP